MGPEHLNDQVTKSFKSSKAKQYCSIAVCIYKFCIHCTMTPSKHKLFAYIHAGLLFLYRTEIDNGPQSNLLFFFCGLTLTDFVALLAVLLIQIY